MRETDDGWEAETLTVPPVRANGSTSERCIAALRRALLKSGPGVGPETLVVEILPVLAGVTEAARVMGWDRRRVVTYMHRGRFPEPIQTLAAGRVWRRADVEAFATAWHARRAGRLGRALPKAKG